MIGCATAPTSTTPIDRFTGDDEVYYRQGNAFLEKDLPERAIFYYSKAIEKNPSFSTLYMHRAIAYKMNGEYDLAWRDVQKAQSMGITAPQNLVVELRKLLGGEE